MKTRATLMLALVALAGCSTTDQTRHSASMVAPSNIPANPPPTRVETVSDTLHGMALTDDFRWLEGNNADPRSPNGPTPRTRTRGPSSTTCPGATRSRPSCGR